MRNLFIISLIFTSAFVSCEDDEPEEVIPNIYYGSLTCSIDSLKESYILDVKNTRIDTGINSGIKFITIEGMDLGSNTLRLQIPGRELGNYKINYAMASLCKYTTKQGIVYLARDGEVSLSKVDFVNKKLSGTFTLKLLRTGYQDTIYVRNGVFEDLPLPKKQ